MKNKSLLILTLTAGVMITGTVEASPPAITLHFSDPQGLCADSHGKTQFAFNYKYAAGGGIEFYSGPVNVTNSDTTMVVPPPPDDGIPHYYSDFEITDQGDCGNMELDYNHLGSCYLTNLIPAADQQSPYSYKITLTPQATGNHTYGTDMYNLNCQVEASLKY